MKVVCGAKKAERNMTENRPIIVVMTPVRNEAWVLRAFLEATSLWADYIIIADQMSTDGSREIAMEYPKVILIDNDRKEMHQAATRRLLFESARKIEGEKLLFALDADEFLSGDFVNSGDWRKILHSRPDDSFSWRWMNLKRNDITKYSTFQHYYWCVHESEDLWKGAFPDNFIHEWRMPWSPKADESHSFLLDDFCSIHLARVNQLRQKNKERFYQVSTVGQNPKVSRIVLYRQYHAEEELEYKDVPEDAYRFYENNGLNIWKYVDLNDEGEYYSSEVMVYFKRDGIKKYALLDIWDHDWMDRIGIRDPRNVFQKLLHRYLSKTTPYTNRFWVRCVDKILKTFV
ncbi:MAG: glycosyltransferase family 2 protein [Bacteroidales bacterium]|nr:glycosyltransferase family 2 protein [Bacteroidales bacterium]